MAEHDESTETEESEDVTRIEFSRGRGRKGSGVESDPVQNTEMHIPLFPELNKDSRHIITRLDIYKLTIPHEGFRGSVSPTTTLEAIGRRYGDGRYNVWACTQDGKVLRRLNDVAIAVNVPLPGDARPAAPPPAQAGEMRLLDFQAAQHEKDADRASKTMDAQIAFMKENAQAQIERDRAFFASQSAQQKEFFGGIMAFMQQSHQIAMAERTSSFERFMVMTEQQHQRALAQNDPMTLLSIFQGGLQLGRGLDEGDNDNPIMQAGKMALEGVKEVKSMMLLQRSQPPRTITPGPSRNPSRQNPKKPAKQANQPVDQQAVIGKLARIRELIETKGYDLEDFLDQNIDNLEKIPPNTEESEETDDEQSKSAQDGAPANGGQSESS